MSGLPVIQQPRFVLEPGRYESHRQSEYAAMDLLQFPLEVVVCLNHAGNRSDVSAVVLFGFGQRFAIPCSSTPDVPASSVHLSENRRIGRAAPWQLKCIPL